MTISLCMITGNEAGIITRCLDSAHDAFDELCLVRAIGEQLPDETLEIAEKWCAANSKQFKQAEYLNRVSGFNHVDDFAAARNLSFSLATGDWKMWLDCDDIVSGETTHRIRELSEHPAVKAWKFAYKLAGGACSVRERLFRHGVGRWVGTIHETHNCEVDVVSDSVAEIIHSPSHPDRESSHTRNLALLRAAHGRTNRNLFYLHEELYWLVQRGDGAAQSEAIQVGKAAIAIRGGDEIEERYEIMLNLGELDKANEESWFMEAMHLQPWRREALSYLCQRAIRVGDRNSAVSWFRMMDSLPKPSPLPWTHREIWHGWARNYLRVRVLRMSDAARGNAEHAENMKDAAYATGVAQYEPVSEKDDGTRTIFLNHASRGRPELALAAFRCFMDDATHPNRITYAVSLDKDDPDLTEYGRLFARERVELRIEDNASVVQAINQSYHPRALACDVVGIVSDDVLLPKGWDSTVVELLAQGGFTKLLKPATPGGRTDIAAVQIAGNLFWKDYGTFLRPEYRSMYADDDLFGWARVNNRVVECPNFIVRHLNPVVGDPAALPMDKTYLRENDPRAYASGRELFQSRKRANFQNV